MKKITALVLALTLALSLTACGGSSDTGAASTPKDTTDNTDSSSSSMTAEELAGGWVDDDGTPWSSTRRMVPMAIAPITAEWAEGIIPRTPASPCWTMTTSTTTSCPKTAA